MTENLIITANLKDLDSINGLITEHNSIANQSYRPLPFHTEDIVKSDRNIVFLLKTKNLLKGYLWLFSNQPFNAKNCEAQIILVIAANFHTKGNGRYLLNFLIEYAKEHTAIEKLIAEIKNNNNASINLFNKFHFIKKHENCIGCTFEKMIKR